MGGISKKKALWMSSIDITYYTESFLSFYKSFHAKWKIFFISYYF